MNLSIVRKAAVLKYFQNLKFMKEPNFFIVGAPKCGTTALSEYLRQHPNIFMSSPKEPHYFAEDLDNYRYVKTLPEYQSLFNSATDQHHCVGEASVFYLFSRVALSKIRDRYPHAKIIVMLRNPVDLVYSFHSELLHTANETVQSFPEAWTLQEKRKQGYMVPRSCREPILLQYRLVGKLGFQLEQLISIFPESQVMTILLDDFAQSTQQVYEKVIDFLDLESDNRTLFPVVNANKKSKVSFLTAFLRRMPNFIVQSVPILKKYIGIEKLGIRERLIDWNTKKVKRLPLDKTLRATMIEEFSADISKLSRLIQLDLSHWLI